MKKTLTSLLSFMLVCVMCVSVFTACKSNDTSSDNDQTTNETETEKSEITDTPDIKDGYLKFRDGEGMVFDEYSTFSSTEPSVHIPKTYEAWIKLPEESMAQYGVIISDFASERGWIAEQPSPNSFSLQITKNRVPQLVYKNEKTSLVIKFNGSKLPANEWVHLAVVDDAVTGTAYCYVNGELKQTVTLSGLNKNFERKISEETLVVGGDLQFNLGNSFKGAIKSVTTFDSLRTQDEIKSDMTGIALNTEGLISCYDIANSKGKTVLVDHNNKYTLKNNRLTGEWLDNTQVAPVEDYDYSIAFLGDTQTMAYYFPEAFHYVFDWLVANTKSHKIEHVLVAGDITESDIDTEWQLAKEQFFRLNGIVDYTLVRGNHDASENFDSYFKVPEYSSRFDGEDAGFMPNSSRTNSYRKLKMGNQDYLILTLNYKPTASELDWAESILQKYTKETVIIVTHSYLNVDGTRLEEGQNVFDRLASKYANVKFCLCGHKLSADVLWVKDKGVNGNVVNQIMVNPQDSGLDMKGPVGMVFMMYFKNGSDEVQARYYSTMYDRYFREGNQYTVNVSDMSEKVFAIK